MTGEDIYNQGILIVDDESHLRTWIGEEIGKAGFKDLYYAADGLECVNTLQEHREAIALIIMDIRLGGSASDPGWDKKEKKWEWHGLETIRHLTNIYDEVVGVLFYTAYSGYREEAKEIGSTKILNLGYQVKSVNMQPLVEAVKKNVRLVINKRKRKISDKDSSLIQYFEEQMSFLKDRQKVIEYGLKNIDDKVSKIIRNKPSILYDIGKSVIVAIILSLFVLLYLSFSLGDLIKDLIK